MRIDVDLERFSGRRRGWNGIYIKYRLVVQRKGVVLPLFETASNDSHGMNSATSAPRTNLHYCLEAKTNGEDWGESGRGDGLRG